MTDNEIKEIVQDYVMSDVFNDLDPPQFGRIMINKKGMVVVDFETFKALVTLEVDNPEELFATLERIKNTTGFSKTEDEEKEELCQECREVGFR